MDLIPYSLVKFYDPCYSGQNTCFQKCTKLKFETKSKTSEFCYSLDSAQTLHSQQYLRKRKSKKFS